MINLVSLLIAAALVSLQCSHEAYAQIESSSNDLDNNLQPNVIPTPRRRLKKFVHISQPPQETVRHIPGAKLELECEAMGNPPPIIHWLKNGERFDDYDEEVNEILAIQPSGIAMMVAKLVVTSSVNGDVFTCVATAGAKQKTASSTVVSNPAEDPEDEILSLRNFYSLPSKPIITAYYKDIIQNIGTSVRLVCRVWSETKTQIIWEDNNEKIVYGNPRIRVLPSGDLLITSLRWGDMGNFTCTAKNAFGVEQAVTFIYPTTRDRQ